MRRISAFFISVIVIAIVGCATTAQRPKSQKDAVSIMSYNVENLFDTTPDIGREDYTFLPRALKNTDAHKAACNKQASYSRRQECLTFDWNEEVLNRKLDRLADVILAVNGGRGPDVLVLIEVENINVLRLLNRRLAAAKYSEEILIEGPDLRGIDIGMLSRLPQAGAAQLHNIKFTPKNEEDKVWMARSRAILHSQFRLPTGDALHVFGLHFPSQANPTYWREQAIDTLNELQKSLPKEAVAIAAGDFNISAEEDASTGLFRDRIRKDWLVSHYIGCGNCEGTHNYRGKWSFLDAIAFSQNLGPEGKSPWIVDHKSINVFKDSRYQMSPYRTPARFNENRPVGVSDHLPLYAEIVLR